MSKRKKTNLKVPTVGEAVSKIRCTFHKETYIDGSKNNRKEQSKKQCRKKIRVWKVYTMNDYDQMNIVDFKVNKGELSKVYGQVL